MKELMIISILLFMSGAFFVCDIRKLIYITIFFIFFPVYIPFMGKDAITTGTICIFILYLKYLTNSLFKKNFIREKYDYWIYALIFLSAFSIAYIYSVGIIDQSEAGRAIRHTFGFFGAALLFLVIKNSYIETPTPTEALENHIEKIFNLFLILVAVHISISITVKFIPSSGVLFTPFLSRQVNILDVYGRGEIERISSFVIGYEAYGEIIAVLTPILIYKIIRYKGCFWPLCLFLFCAGQILAVTRSGIILFITGILIALLYYSRKKLGKTVAVAYSLSISIILALMFTPAIFGNAIERFSLITKTYNKGGTLIEILNRKDVFNRGWEEFLNTISLLGNGISDFHFHNLYLTALYEKGIIGGILFLVIFFYPVFQLFKALKFGFTYNKDLIFLCFLSSILFLINEFKYEFLRGSSYQQICLGLFATYYLVFKNSQIKQKQ